ncbi:MAG: hypothetical protein ABW321_32630, partial [Polyangiales bacterium]
LGCNALAGNDPVTLAPAAATPAGDAGLDGEVKPPPPAANEGGGGVGNDNVGVGTGGGGGKPGQAGRGGRGGEPDGEGEAAAGAGGVVADGGKGGQAGKGGRGGDGAAAGRPSSGGDAGSAGAAAADSGTGGAGGAGGAGAEGGAGGDGAGATGGAGAPSEPPTGCARPNPPCQPDDEPSIREIACARCGSQLQVRSCDPVTCEWGSWTAGGECIDQGVCEPGETMAGSKTCGVCPIGTQATQATCNNSCTWDAPVDMGSCVGGTGACTPGQSETRDANCMTCGQRKQTRTCNAQTCAWNAWADSSACTWCEDCAEIVYCDAPAANRGTWCRQKACSRPQAEGDCGEDIRSVCGSVTQPYYFEPL